VPFDLSLYIRQWHDWRLLDFRVLFTLDPEQLIVDSDRRNNSDITPVFKHPRVD